MNAAYHDEIARRGADLITAIGLIDADGAELREVPRRRPRWSPPGGGTVELAAPLTFGPIPAGVTVAGWRGYGASGTDYGGAALAPVGFPDPWEFVLERAVVRHGADQRVSDAAREVVEALFRRIWGPPDAVPRDD